MEQWRDAGVVLAASRHGENGIVLSLFTAHYGRQRGLIRGKPGALVAQPGTVVSATWRARLGDHLGSLTAEVLEVPAGGMLDDPLRLAALSALCASLDVTLPERDPLPALYAVSLDLLAHLSDGISAWQADYARWELALLTALGYGLDLSTCAVTGGLEDLRYVSPKSGRAVSTAGAGVWAERLLALPAFLRTPEAPATASDLQQAFALSGHFLSLWAGVTDLPARERLIQRLRA